MIARGRRLVAVTVPAVLTVAVGAGSGGAPVAASPAPGVVSTAALRYLPATVSVDQGSTLQLVNLEPPAHNVTSTMTGADGDPLFSSATISVGVADVTGVSALAPGGYPFFCTVHEDMLGVLVVERGDV